MIQIIENLVNIGGVLVPAAIALLAYLGLRRPPLESQPLLRPVTLDTLYERFGKGGLIAWIDRDATDVEHLTRRRLVITGPPKIGKSREATELIHRAIRADRVRPSRIFEPTPHLKGADHSSIGRQILKDIETDREPLLLLLDDLPGQFRVGQLDRLAAALDALKDCRPHFVVATARADRLESGHHAWLTNRNFISVWLPAFNASQVERLVDNAAGVAGVQLAAEARAALIETSDGTPELTRLTLSAIKRELDKKGFREANRQLVEPFLARGIRELWLELRQELVEERPETAALLQAIAIFYAARVTPYTDLVLALAACDLEGLGRARQLRALLPQLETYTIRQEGDRLRFLEYIAEAEGIEGNAARRKLGSFLMSYRRWLVKLGLHRFHGTVLNCV